MQSNSPDIRLYHFFKYVATVLTLLVSRDEIKKASPTEMKDETKSSKITQVSGRFIQSYESYSKVLLYEIRDDFFALKFVRF